jgi:beta-lactamase regulating signal transducer with metallopeptidase domain
MTALLDFHSVAQFSSLRIVDSLVGGTIISGFAAALLRVARRSNAGTRFAIWFAALVAIATLPFAGALSSHSTLSTIHPAVTVPDSWAYYVFGAWAIVATFFLIGVGRAFWHVYALRRNCIELDSTLLDPALQETMRRAQLKRSVALCTSSDVRVPTALGLMKPAIVIPDWALTELSSSELNQVVLHELAHLRRWDDWTNLAQQIIRALLFFHPAVWWIGSKAELEREMACDDAVLAETESPRAYAECLAHLAERSFVQRSLALAQAAIGHLRQTTTRVEQILDVNRPKESKRSWKPAVSLVAGFALVCGIGVSKAPKLIAFGDTQSAQASSVQSADVTPAQDFPQFAPVTSAKLRVESTPRHANVPKPASHRTILRPKAGHLVHLTSITVVQPVPVAQALFVVFHGDDLSTAQIQMWRVTVLRYVIAPVASQTPAKKT